MALVVGDPPWGDLAAWGELGRFAQRVLVPNGVLLGYIGTRWCYDVIRLLSTHLTPVRMAFLPSQHLNAWDPSVRCEEVGSFMAIMANGDFNPPGTWRNVVPGEVEGRRWHPYQRPLANVRHYIDAFTRPGDVVVDPFVGSGTTAIACVELDRRMVGCDNDPNAVQSTISRLASMNRPPPG